MAGKTASGGRLALAGALSMGAALGVGRFVYTPILPAMATSLRLSPGQSGAIASANFAGYLLGAVLASAPGLTARPRLWLQIALLISATTTGAMAFPSHFAAFLVLRASGGAASAFVLVFASSVVLSRLAIMGRDQLSAVHFAGVGCAIVISAVMVSAMERAGLDWRALWAASGALCLLASAGVALLLRTEAGPPSSTPRAETGEATGPIVALMAAYGLFGFGYVITATFLVAMVRTYPAARAVAPFVWMMVGAAAIPSVVLWTRLGYRIGVRRAFSIACAIEAVGVGVSVLRPTIDGAVSASLLLGGTYMGITALGLDAARQARPRDSSRILGTMTAAFGLGQMVGPGLAGWLAERTGDFGLASLLAAGALLAAAVLTLPRPRAGI